MIVADLSLDTLGLYCPIPIILTSKKMKQMAIGQVVEVLSDDVGIKKDMPAWCRTSGQELLQLVEEGKIYKCYVRKMK